jgi:hypothetical protein
VIAKIRIARMKTDSFNVHLFLSTACYSSGAKARRLCGSSRPG